MPPAISEDEASASDSEIPFKEVDDQKTAEDEADADEADEADEAEGDEYVVEKIVSHQFEPDGTVKYEIKWMGYEAKTDHTWEPEENLEGAKDVLEEYFAKRGGRPQKPKAAKRKSAGATATPEVKGSARRKRTKVAEASASPAAKEEPVKAKNTFQPPKGSWEDHVQAIETVEETPDPKTGTNERWAYVLWIDPAGKKTKHNLRTVNQKCPQKMLRYYEQHLVFASSSSSYDEFDESDTSLS